ncbi:hypothetical protein Ciccas_013058 [Cichlidogyrus casuarinus]|uniref:Uncharacterized protein n=1 Tax=Cichlidogyrus casuarinus TaxID=1844966 RepID=A0ABD2PMY2_9PLAT
MKEEALGTTTKKWEEAIEQCESMKGELSKMTMRRSNSGELRASPSVQSLEKFTRRLSEHNRMISAQLSQKNEQEDVSTEGSEELDPDMVEQHKRNLKLSQLRLADAKKRVRDLGIGIRLKEQLIKNLVKSNNETAQLNKNYEERIKLLEQVSA